MDFDSFFSGLAQQESGGSYNAINGSSGALGKYQILPSNVGPWSQKYLGQTWTPQQFLQDQYKQDALARAVLQDYYDKWGPRGAASAWYSGNPALANDYKSQHGGPSIGDYVDQVLAKATGTHAAYATKVLDQTVNAQKAAAQQQQQQRPADSAAGAQMGAVSAQGIEAVHFGGTDAVVSPGSQQVGKTNEPTDMQSVSGVGGPSTAGNVPQNHITPSGNLRQFALQQGEQFLGTPYVLGGGGGSGPSKSAMAHGNYQDVGFDCSGLVQYVLGQAGISAPRLSYDQLAMGQRVPMNQLQPGDLVGFGDGGHIAIYMGNGQVLEAAHTGAPVRVRPLGQNEDVFGVSLAAYYK